MSDNIRPESCHIWTVARLPIWVFDRLIVVGSVLARRFWEECQWARRDADSSVQQAWLRHLV
jgi:hypothetical protein